MKKILALCFLCCVLLTAFSGCTKDVLIECPNFVGKDYTVVSTGEQYDMFKFEAEYIDNGDINGGVILSQGTPAGEKIERGSTVKVTVSLGAPKKTVPDVKGKTSAEAESALKDVGFTVTEVHAPNSDYKAGICFSTSPAIGTDAPTGSEILLYISLGADKKLVKYINITGKKYDDAVESLNKIGLNIGRVEYVESNKPSGTVVKQFPKYDKTIEIAEGSLINLTVAK